MKLKTVAMTGVLSLAGLGLIGVGAHAAFTTSTTSAQQINGWQHKHLVAIVERGQRQRLPRPDTQQLRAGGIDLPDRPPRDPDLQQQRHSSVRSLCHLRRYRQLGSVERAQRVCSKATWATLFTMAP